VQAQLQQAIALHQRGALEQAVAIYGQILAAYPNHHTALHLSGVVALQKRNYEQARELIGKAIELNPNDPTYHYHLGITFLHLNRFDPAVAHFDKAIALKRDYKEAYLNRGIALFKRDEPAAAIKSYDKAVALKRDYAEAYCNRGAALAALERYDAAVANYDRAIALKPDYAEAYFNRGNLQKDLGNQELAIADYDKAVAIDPRYVKAYCNRGAALFYLRRLEEAIADFDAATHHAPAFAEAHLNRGLALHELRLPDQAIAAFDTAIALDPACADAHFAKGVTLLLTGRLREGWSGYQWRWKRDAFLDEHPLCPEPLWLGEQSLSGKSILLHSEQGLGDTIQFCRYARMVADLGAAVSLEVQPSLCTLLKDLDPRVTILPRDSSSPNGFDFHCPLMSLPLAFQTELDTIPAGASYLHADPSRVAHWADRIGSEGFKIGVCWQGQTGRLDIGRSFPAVELLPIAQIPGVRLISLQKGVGLSQLTDLPPTMRMESLEEDFDVGEDAFVDTAAVIGLCDLVISPDTSIAHLAGALGACAWVALKHVPEWRWLLDREDSPWYPSARLFRQDRPGDWRGVFAKMAKAIATQAV
jgi:tetratricopeptide (TPR) repeat protein